MRKPPVPPTRKPVRDHGRWVAVAVLLCIVGWAIWSYETSGIVWDLLSPRLSADEKVAAIQKFFAGWGVFAPLVYVLVIVVEVIIAPIPGMMLYMPGGVIFGGFWGGTLSLLGNILGAGLACTLMRTLAGRQATESFFARHSLEKYHRYIEDHGMVIIALLRLNPLTSSDLVSYAAGLTSISVWKVMLATGMGLTITCYVQAYLAQEIFRAIPWLIWPLIVVGLGYIVVAAVIISRLRYQPQVEAVSEGPTEDPLEVTMPRNLPPQQR